MVNYYLMMDSSNLLHSCFQHQCIALKRPKDAPAMRFKRNKKGPPHPRGPQLTQTTENCCVLLSGMHGQGVTVFHREDLDEPAAFLRPVVQQVVGPAALRSHVVFINELEQFRLIG